MKIRTEVLILLLLAILITGGVVTAASATISKSASSNQAYNHLEATTQSRAKHIETFLEDAKETLEILTTSFIIKNFLTTSKEDAEYAAQCEVANARLNSMLGDSSQFIKLSVLDENGIVVASSDEDFVGSDRSTAPSFLEGRAGTYIKDIHACEVTGKPAMSIATPIVEKNELLGIMVAGISRAGVCWQK